MKIAVIGQSLFGQEVYRELRKDGHTVVGVFTIPDKDGKADPLGESYSTQQIFMRNCQMSLDIVSYRHRFHIFVLSF